MSGLGTKGHRDKKVPVFLFPEELKFVVGDQSSHKQVLTLYNPYDFNISFEVFSNAPKKYTVVESKGFIKAHCCVDIVVRHQMVGHLQGGDPCKDKFRIDIHCDERVIGRKLVPSIIVQETLGEDKQGNVRQKTDDFFRAIQLPTRTAATPSPSLLMVVVALLCLLILLLPLEGESPHWSSYLHITVNQKLITAFTLGQRRS